jgi:anti-sigma regulatory factor (Ser/Thr protein kinase)
MGARHEIRAFVALQADERSDLDAVELIAGELITNVVRYAPGPVGIHCAWDGEDAVLIIADRGPGIPAVRAVPDAQASHGRGLSMIQALAKDFAIDTVAGHGTRIVVKLPAYRTVPAGEEAVRR